MFLMWRSLEYGTYGGRGRYRIRVGFDGSFTDGGFFFVVYLVGDVGGFGFRGIEDAGGEEGGRSLG